MEGLKDTLEFLRSRTDVRPEVGLVLGSGLDFFHRKMKVEAAVPYAEIPGFPVSTVAGHAGRFLFGEIAGKKAVVMQGRVHYYEGYSMAETVLPVRAMIGMGAKKLLLTNAAGGINPDFEVNTFMALKDHIACFVPSPLRGPNDKELGPRFPDMTSVYDPEFLQLFLRTARACRVRAATGVYLQTSGPQFETPAEVALFRSLGADAVGMSTAAEAIAARHAGARVLAVSRISNAAAGYGGPLSHEEVSASAREVEEAFCSLTEKLIAGM